jgi:hypothetical protein
VIADAIALRVQRHFQNAFGRPVTISTRRGAVTALDVTLDYRSDALVVWEQGGSIWARELRANGRLQPLQRVGSSAPHPQLQAVVSDDNRAIVSWASSVGPRTHVWISISAPLVRFGAPPRLLEAIRDPAGARLPDGSLRMTRLSSEGVLIAWTGEEAGRHAVRAAAVGLDGVKPVTTLSNPATDSVLADLASGPHAEAIAIWTAAAPSAQRLLVAARGVVGAGARASFGWRSTRRAASRSRSGRPHTASPTRSVHPAPEPAPERIAFSTVRGGHSEHGRALHAESPGHGGRHDGCPAVAEHRLRRCATDGAQSVGAERHRLRAKRRRHALLSGLHVQRDAGRRHLTGRDLRRHDARCQRVASALRRRRRRLPADHHRARLGRPEAVL